VTPTCPYCDSEDCKEMSPGVIRCNTCGSYYELDDDMQGNWDRSSRHKTRMEDGYDFDEFDNSGD
jgi:ribosomal protein L37AE/L43A